MYLWSEAYRASLQPNVTVQELIHLLDEYPFAGDVDVRPIRERLRTSINPSGDIKWWRFSRNGVFTVKSFYNFLIDEELRCPVIRFFWQNWCPKKINLFNWLAWLNKILSLENLARRRCNRMPTDTCVLCLVSCVMWGLNRSIICSFIVLLPSLCGTTSSNFCSHLIHLHL